jgi:transposase
MVQRMLGPEGMSATALAKDVGISQPTLSRWLRQAHSLKGMNNKTNDDQQPSRPPHKWTAEERFRVVLEAASIPDEQLGAFLRKKGLHCSHLEEWRKAAIVALQNPKKSKPSPEAKRIRELEKDLRRKEKALAEVTALLALKKKIAEIWGDGDDDTPTRKGT